MTSSDPVKADFSYTYQHDALGRLKQVDQPAQAADASQNGVAYNIDSPLDSQYVGQFDTAHYAGSGSTDAGTDALHVVRPRISDARRAQLREWIGILKRNLSGINGERAQIKFQSDYLVPSFVRAGLTTRQTVTILGRIIVEADTDTKLPMYCSEFAWHMLALSACSTDDAASTDAQTKEKKRLIKFDFRSRPSKAGYRRRSCQWLCAGLLAAAVVGWLIGRSTDRPIVRAIVRQVLFTVIPALITFAIGNALGVGTG